MIPRPEGPSLEETLMKLYYSPASPYVRKVMVVAHETGLNDKIEMVTVGTTPVAPDAGVAGAIARTTGAMPGALVLCREARVTRPRAFERVPVRRAPRCALGEDVSRCYRALGVCVLRKMR